MRRSGLLIVLLVLTAGACDTESGGVASTTLVLSTTPSPRVSIAASCDGLTCEFEATSSNGSAAPAHWKWDFGDGATSSYSNPSHTYAAAGEYLVTADAIGPSGVEIHAEQIVTTTKPADVPVELTWEITEYPAGRYRTRWDHADPGFTFSIDDTWWISDFSRGEDSGDWGDWSPGLGRYVGMTPGHDPHPPMRLLGDVKGPFVLIGAFAEVWQPEALEHRPVDDLAEALVADSRLEVQSATNTTVDGFDATRIEARIVDWQPDLEPSGDQRFWLGTSDSEGEMVPLIAPRPAGSPNGRFWVVDADGAEVLIAACYGDESADVFEAELDGIVDSIEFLPPVGEARVTKTLHRGGDEVVIANGTPKLHAAAEWALLRFEAAGIGVPALASVTFAAQDQCLAMPGEQGAIQVGSDVYLCFGEGVPDMSIRRRLLHEFGHAWTDTYLDATSTERFLAMRGLAAWDGADVPYEQRGSENAAEILAWGLYGEPIAAVRLDDATCATLADGFRTLTAAEPLTDPDPVRCTTDPG